MKTDPAQQSPAALLAKKAALVPIIDSLKAVLGQAVADGDASAEKSALATLKQRQDDLVRVEAGLAEMHRREQAAAARRARTEREQRHRAAMVQRDAVASLRLKFGRTLAQAMEEASALQVATKALAVAVPESRIGLLCGRLPDELGALVATAARDAGLNLPSSPPIHPDTDEHRLGRDLAAEIERALGRVDDTPPLAAE